MLNKIIAFSIRNKFVVLIMTLTLVVWGIWSATKLPIDAVPDITNNQVQIITVCPTLASQEVEQLVTYPIERSITNLPDLVELRSISRFGLSLITVVFKEEVDVYFARQLISERLKEAESNIPPGVGVPELGPVSTGLGEIYQYIIHPKKGSEKKYSAMDLRTMQDWIVARQLYGTPGIAEVNSFGGLLKQYEVAVNPNKLLAMEVSIPEIFTALEKNNENTGGAYIDKKPNAYFIRGVGLVSSFDDIRNIVVKSNPNGIPILISDVAEVQWGNAVRYGAMTYNGQVDAVGGVVMMLKGANSAEVVTRVKEKMSTIQKSLPEDVEIEPYLDRTDLVQRAISTVETNLIEGALIVIFVLVLFLGNLRAGLIVASAIPLSLLFALGMMNVFGVSANLMSLGAIDFGLIVDGAVIIVEATLHHLGLRKGSHRFTQKEMDEEVYHSASKIRSSAAFGEIIILIVYIPILTLVGIEGKMFGPMAQTVGFAIFGALVLSLTYIPMMCAWLLSKNPGHKKNFSDRMMEALQKLYTPLLERAIHHKKIVLGITLGMLSLSLVLFARMGGEFIPTLQEGDFAFHCILPQGTSLSQSIETSMQASRILKEFDEVKMVVGKTGSAEVPTDPMPPEASDMIIILKQPSEWKRSISYEQLAEEMLDKLSIMPGVFFESNQPIQMRFNELMTGIRQDVAVKIFGENMDTLLAYANQVHGIVQGIEGTTEPSVERVDGLPQIVIKYNRSQIAYYGMNIQDINQLVSAAFAGGKAGVVYENERKFDLVVRLDSLHRSQVDDVGHLYIPTPDGNQIPLSQVAEIRMESGPAQISREGGKRRIVVGFNVKGKDIQTVVNSIQKELDARVKLPEAYYFTFGGAFENLQAASKRLMIAVPIALLLIFILLYFTFTSMLQATLIFSAIPMAAIGGVFALLLRDMPFSISAGVGFIALFGVAVLNGIVLIGTFNQLKKDGMDDITERVREGTRIRLRPVLMTAMVASLGFLPMALSHGAGAEVQKPLATVVIGGLISATFLTLFVLPLLYMLFTAVAKKRSGSRSKRAITTSLFLVLALGSTSQAHGQTKEITLEEALNTAMKNNPGIKAGELYLESADILKRSVLELPKTELNFQYGQYNSINRDFGFQISQSIPFPGYYSAKAGLYRAEREGSVWLKEGLEKDLKARVYSAYSRLLYLQKAKNSLQGLDSLYMDFVKAATLKYQTGETNLLEKTTAETKRGQLTLILQHYESEYAKAYHTLKTLMNTNQEFTLAEADQDFKPLELKLSMDTSLLANNPSLKGMYQQVILAQQSKKVEVANVLPTFTLGYFNQSLIGPQTVNGTEVYYDATTRFQGVNVGIGIPLTFFSNNAKIRSINYKQQALQKEADNGKLQMQNELYALFRDYQLMLTQLEFYTQSALPNADLIVSAATLGYKNGETAYMEYVQALQTAGDIRLNHLQLIDQLNQTIIQINLLTNQ